MKLSEATQFLRSNGYLVEKQKHVLNQAAKSKDDEFYTYMKDIVKELKHYNFGGKIVYCCCDNPEWSNFYKYFEENFDSLGLKGLISSHYETSGETYWTEYYGDKRIDHPLKGNGDCTSPECQALAKKAIPDTDEVLGVPVSILQNVDPDNLPFEILGVDGKLKLNGETVFDRLIIKLKGE